ncbi:hypothetical protein CHN50_11825 [Priestia aryabhattai]|uniref:HD domain-containing protein n=1 Tax=Priestia flexa TaxID=86664 RepID=UPI000BA12B00|nr:HD domain-containing protein [Priestia flexa]MDT2047702.1 HD domain-containing protein [Priestia flexa]OZT12585.1 hypothetical protein CHN50_11825 [Priestia aryabhattai]
MDKSMYKNFDYLRLIDNYKEYNNPFSHDFNIIFQSSPCQLLSEKMQLIPDPKHYNNRLSHSLDVCKIACLIVDYLNVIMEKNHIKLINKELIKAISFAHDIGHPPFGHTGERSLDQIMLKSGGFESNAQTIRLMISDQFNVTFRTLISLLKHKRIIPNVRKEGTELIKGYYGYMSGDIERLLSIYQENVLEQYIIDMADTISYVISDIKDLIVFLGKTRFIQLVNMYFTVDKLFEDSRHIFKHIGTKELLYLVTDIIKDINENILGPLLNSIENKTKARCEQSIISKFVNNISLKVNDIDPMYSELEIPIQDQLKLFLLNQITRKCFLESEFNKGIDTKIDLRINKTFEYLFSLNTDVTILPLEQQNVQNLLSITNDTNKARYVCDLMCQLSENQILHLISHLEERIILT